MAATKARGSVPAASGRKKPPSLREDLKRRTRERLEAATIRLIRKQGFRATSVDQIARAAGTTRTTFYQYFKSKGDLIHFMQEAYIAPEMIAICKRLDDIRQPTWQQLREWVVDYSQTWERIHVFFEAYADASITDPDVAATSVPNTYLVTGHMINVLDRYTGAERQRVHDKLVILISVISQMLALTKGQHDDPRNSHLLDNFTDLFWDALFSRLPAVRERKAL
jgi:AcrR family transcriptional regulator